MYAPSANAVAGALVPPAQRGRALAIVNGGTSFAIVLGVPLGAVIGTAVGWRMTFAGVALLAAIATIGLAYGLPKGFGKGLPVATLKERIDVAKKPAVLAALLGTTLWATGAYAVYTYVASYVDAVVGPHVVPLGAILFVWGLAAASGVYLGGRFADKLGYRRVIATALTVLAISFAVLTVIARALPASQVLLPFLVTLVSWGLSAWAFIAPQMTRLIGVAGIGVAAVALSLNASFMFLGFSMGAALGAFTLSHGNAGDLGWVGMLCEIASLAVLLMSDRRKPAVAVATA
jgi:predicted MFS family arabinose efflux permease